VYNHIVLHFLCSSSAEQFFYTSFLENGSFFVVLQDTQGQGNGIPTQFSRKQHFIVPAQTQQTPVQRLSPENKGALHYIPLQAGYRSKKQGLTHMWLHTTIVYMQPYPQCSVTFFMFRFFKFYLPAMPFPSPCYIIRTQTCLLLFWPSSLLHYSPL
jgi:hypothetical protein